MKYQFFNGYKFNPYKIDIQKRYEMYNSEKNIIYNLDISHKEKEELIKKLIDYLKI